MNYVSSIEHLFGNVKKRIIHRIMQLPLRNKNSFTEQILESHVRAVLDQVDEEFALRLT